jgi:hypothetical protein
MLAYELRCHPSRCPHCWIPHLTFLCQLNRKTEIRNFYITILGYQYIITLQISMYLLLPMQNHQSLQYLSHNIRHNSLTNRRTIRYQRCQWSSIHKFYHHIDNLLKIISLYMFDYISTLTKFHQCNLLLNPNQMLRFHIFHDTNCISIIFTWFWILSLCFKYPTSCTFT